MGEIGRDGWRVEIYYIIYIREMEGGMEIDE
jgi:hypothetical protein